ncbi:MAG: response regulator [Thermodesulfobacteriota bacterium]|nr:response regulator [Thermodesulfobacteriota bacterium]
MKKKALVIDDDVCFLNIAVECLSDRGFAVTSALRATCPMIEQNSATCPFATFGYDIILSDNRMPGMTGLEFFEYQRQRGCKLPPCCKALISGDISGEDQRMAESIGYKVFHKPTPLALIDQWIDDVLDNHSETGGMLHA